MKKLPSLTVQQYLDFANQNNYKNYCEIIILRNGKIIPAIPSHCELLVNMYCNKENIQKYKFKKIFPNILDPISFICEKYSCISVWYNVIRRPRIITTFQRKTIDALVNNNCIAEDYKTRIVTEYSWYLNNKERHGLEVNL